MQGRTDPSPDAGTTPLVASGGVPFQNDEPGVLDEKTAIAGLYETHVRELWAKLYGLCGDAERAHDAVQESFLRLQAYGVARVRHPGIWLFHVGRNWLRDLSRRRADDEITVSTAHDSLAAESFCPATAAMQGELRTSIRAALRQLKLIDREVLVLRYGLGWSSIQIAVSLNSQPSAVDMRLSRARSRLAAQLKREGVEYPYAEQEPSPRPSPCRDEGAFAMA